MRRLYERKRVVRRLMFASALLLWLLPGLALAPVAADLVINEVDTSGVTIDPQTLALGGTVTARVANQGDADAGGFTLLLFDDRNGNGMFDNGTDLVLGSTGVAGLPAGGTEAALAPVGGTALLAGNLIHAMADSTDAVPEMDEDNNLSSAGLESLTLDKLAIPSTVPAIGGAVTFVITVENVGPSTLRIDEVVDDQFGIVSDTCDMTVPAMLAPGSFLTCTFVEILSGIPSVPHVNVATAFATDTGGNPQQASDHAMVGFFLPCDPDPRTQGYWLRQCLGVPADDDLTISGIDPGRNGRGPQVPTEPDFDKLMLDVNALLETTLGPSEAYSCATGMDAHPPSDPCEKAIKQYTALLFNIASGRLQESCGVNPTVLQCTSTNMADLIQELADLINSGDEDACEQAQSCAGNINEGEGIDPNLPPVALDDLFSTDEDVPVSGNVLDDNGLGVDFDPDFDPLTVDPLAVLMGPFDGSVVLNPDGSFTYTPDPDFNGTDVWEYRLEDGRGGTDIGLVTITVNPVNDPPTAEDDSFVTDEDTVLNGNVLADNGNGPDSDIDNDPLSVTPIPASGPSDGTLVLGANGAFTYTPNLNFFGVDSFDYLLEDGQGASDIATVTITVNPVNDPPVAQDDNVAVEENDVLNGNVLVDNGNGADSDPESDPLSVNPVPVSGPSNGTLVLNADGTFTYTPDPGATGDTFEYELMDSGGLSDVGEVTIDVQPVDNPPTAVDDDATVFQNAAATPIDVLANENDPDGGPRSIDSVTQPAGGTVIITGGGTGLTYQPDPGFCNDGTPTDDFTYTLLPGGSSATVRVTVICNQPPAPTIDPVDYAALGNTQLRAGGAVGTSVASVTDVAGILVKAAPVDPDAGPLPTTIVPFTGPTTNGDLQLNADGSFLYEPNPGFTGVDTYIYSLTDGASTGNGTLRITVTEQVWYVDNTATAGGDGRSTAPFDTLKNAESPVSGDGDTIFVFEGDGSTTNQANGFILGNGQKLLGQGVDLMFPGFGTLVSASNPPEITNGGGAGVSVLNNVADAEIRGLDVSGGSVGVLLTNSQNVTLATMTIEDLTDFGIDGSTVTDLALDGVHITNCGDAVGEAGMRVNGLRGTGNEIVNSTLTASATAERAVQIISTVGDATVDVLTISGSTFKDTFASPVGADTLEISLGGFMPDAANLKVDITGSVFQESRTNGVQVLASDDSQAEVNISNSNFTDMGIGIDLATDDSAALTFDISGNPTIEARPGFGTTMVNVVTFGASSATGRVNNNPSIVVGGGSGTGIRLIQNDSSNLVAEVMNNVISGVVNDIGIDAFARNGNGRLDATISDNTVTVGILALYDIRVQAGNGGGDTNTACANLINNSTSGGGITAFRERTADAGATVLLEGFNTDAATTWSLNGNSPAASVSSSNNGTLGGGTCNTVP